MHADDSKRRELIPKWRPFSITRRLHELKSVGSRKHAIPKDDVRWSEKLREWRTDRDIPSAWSVLEAAVVENRALEVSDAADFVLNTKEYVPRGLRKLAESVSGARLLLNRASKGHLVDLSGSEPQDSRQRISTLRRITATGPHNAIAWVDLALAYSNIGAKEKALRAMRVAISLAPENRFVLRSASRFYVHADDAEQAHSMLVKARRTPHDPWLISAEIAAARIARRSPKFIKRAREIVQSDNFSAFDLSEVTSGLGTIEIYDGSTKRGKKLFELSLRNPNDNALAQAEWADRNFRTGAVRPSLFRTPLSYEARTWENYIRGKIHKSSLSAESWMNDEPFSTQPRGFLTFLHSCLTHNYDLAIKLAEEGLIINPDSSGLRNNLAIALARKGDASRAEKEISSVEIPKTNSDEAINLATRGLIAFRSGKLDEGRKLYEQAIEVARKVKGDRWLALRAWIYFASEEVAASPQDGVEIMDLVQKQIKRFPNIPVHIAIEINSIVEGIKISIGQKKHQKTALISSAGTAKLAVGSTLLLLEPPD